MIPIFVTIATVVLLVGTALPLLNRTEWWIRGWDFPRVQLLGLATVILVFEMVRIANHAPSNVVRLVLAAGCALYHAAWIFPYTRLKRREILQTSQPESASGIRILSFNVLTPNRHADAFLTVLKREQPDVIVTVETDQWWEKKLEPLLATHPHTAKCPLDNLYGMHLFSRYPLEDCRVQFLVENDKPSIHTLIRLPDSRRVELHCLHPAPPSPTENDTSSERDAELVMVGKAVKDSPYPVIVTGDLNDVAWSKTTRLFRKVSGLLDPRIGRGFYNTFHAKLPFFRWPVDHIFTSRHFTLRELRRLENCGSDHFPVLIHLILEDGAAAEQIDAGLEAEPEDHAEANEKVEAEGVSPTQVHRPRRRSAPAAASTE